MRGASLPDQLIRRGVRRGAFGDVRGDVRGDGCGDPTADSPAIMPTGYPLLDGMLGGGWPAGVLIEVLVDDPGLGEFGLLAPALSRLTRGARTRPPEAPPPAPPPAAPVDRPVAADQRGAWVMLLAPPHIPYAPGLSQHGLELSRLLVVWARQQPDVLWAMEETLSAGACAGVIAWAGPAGRLALQRIQLAAGRGRAWAVLVRAVHCRAERSPAALRLQLRTGELQGSGGTATGTGMQVEVFKNRFGRSGTVLLEPLR